MAHPPDQTRRIPVARLARRGGLDVELVPDAAARAALAAELALLDLPKLRLSGRITPDGDSGWRLDATLGATVVQSCGVTLQPVTTRIDEAVTRRYARDTGEPEPRAGEEIEMPEDDTLEPLAEVIDLDAVLTEALALALPIAPRRADAGPARAAAAPDDAAPDDGDPPGPFDALSGLRDRLARGGPGGEGG
jgi:uncharacterized metal-binding protein YceD (DUF177 family)